MFNLFKKTIVHPEAKNNPCECAVKFYLSACEKGTMKFTINDFYEAINTRMHEEVNKYFCHCQPERKESKQEDLLYCCQILTKLKYIFKGNRALVDIKKYVHDLIEDCEINCSRHQRNNLPK